MQVTQLPAWFIFDDSAAAQRAEIYGYSLPAIRGHRSSYEKNGYRSFYSCCFAHRSVISRDAFMRESIAYKSLTDKVFADISREMLALEESGRAQHADPCVMGESSVIKAA